MTFFFIYLLVFLLLWRPWFSGVLQLPKSHKIDLKSSSPFSTRGMFRIVSTILAWSTPSVIRDTFVDEQQIDRKHHYRRRLLLLTTSHTENELELFPTDKQTWIHVTHQCRKHKELMMKRLRRSNGIIYAAFCVARDGWELTKLRDFLSGL